MPEPIKSTAIVQKNVPGYLAKPIGHIVTRWAFFEFHLSHVIWDLLEVDQNVGLVAVASPRAHEKLDNIRDLLFLKKKIVIDDKIFSKLRNRIVEIGGLRDDLCHGTWRHDERGWSIISTRGYVKDQTIERIERSRKFRPERMGVTVAGLAPILEAIDDLIYAVEDMWLKASSPEKLPKRSLRRQLRRRRDTHAKP